MDKLTRRALLVTTGTPIVGALLIGPVVGRSATLVEQWMDAWMSAERLPEGALYVGRFKDPIYFLTQSIGWRPNNIASKLQPVTVPKGFVTDFASIPRIFFSLLRPDGEYTYAAIIHDYLYWEQITSKETADSTLREAMKDFGVDAATAFT